MSKQGTIMESVILSCLSTEFGVALFPLMGAVNTELKKAGLKEMKMTEFSSEVSVLVSEGKVIARRTDKGVEFFKVEAKVEAKPEPKKDKENKGDKGVTQKELDIVAGQFSKVEAFFGSGDSAKKWSTGHLWQGFGLDGKENPKEANGIGPIVGLVAVDGVELGLVYAFIAGGVASGIVRHVETAGRKKIYVLTAPASGIVPKFKE